METESEQVIAEIRAGTCTLNFDLILDKILYSERQKRSFFFMSSERDQHSCRLGCQNNHKQVLPLKLCTRTIGQLFQLVEKDLCN